MKRFRKASIPDDINGIEQEKINKSTLSVQEQLSESPDEMPVNMAFEPNAQMDVCIRNIQYNLLPVLTSGEIQMTGEVTALYTSLIRCITEFNHALHAIRAIHAIKGNRNNFGVQDNQVFGVLIGQQLLAQDEMRMESFKEMTYTLSQMSKLNSMQQSGIANYMVKIVDKCEAAMGQDVSEYYLMS